MILLSDVKTSVDYSLKTTVGTAITPEKFVDGANRAIDILQTLGDYSPLKRKKIISFLDGESDYDISANFGITDYKQVFDIRPIDTEYQGEFEYRGEKKFAVRKSQSIPNDEYTVEEVNGAEIFRLLRDSNNASSLVLHSMDSLTADGTWGVMTSTTTDATGIAVNTTRFREGSGSIEFDITVATSVQNYAGIELTTAMTQVDLSDYQNIGVFRFSIDLEKLTSAQLGYITSIELRVGNSSSVYRAITTTTTADGGSFINNWNRVSFNWADGTDTGSPDWTAVDYLAVIVNYSASMTNASDIKVDEIKVFVPEYLEFWYFSRFMVAPTATSTTFQERFTATYTGTENLRLPRQCLQGMANLILSLLYPQKTKNTDMTGDKYYQKFLNDWNDWLDAGIVILPKKEDEEAQAQGNSSGRTEGHLMW